ncbi:hypothetical protein VTI28DRAFT_7198 [Corynascus sepedonium]
MDWYWRDVLGWRVDAAAGTEVVYECRVPTRWVGSLAITKLFPKFQAEGRRVCRWVDRLLSPRSQNKSLRVHKQKSLGNQRRRRKGFLVQIQSRANQGVHVMVRTKERRVSHDDHARHAYRCLPKNRGTPQLLTAF